MLINFIFILLLIFNLLFLFISMYNFFTAPKLQCKKAFNDNTFLSVLIPARNEEKNIGNILSDLINQSYKNFEVIVLNDNSIDATEEIIKSFTQKDKRIKLINGKEIPEGWLGKNYACHQLSQQANGDLFLFIDADVLLSKYALESVLKTFEEKKIKMLSVFPTQIIQNISTYLVTPMMNWILLTFLPLKKVYSSKMKSFVAANGQLILIDRNTYFKIGGHESVKDKIVEDMELARKIKSLDLKMMTLLGNNVVSCKMYSSFKDAFNGFSKNFYSGFNTNPILFSLLLIFIQMVFILPTFLVLFDFKFILPVFLIVVSRIFISYISNQNILINTLLHPLQIIIVFLVGINSMMISYLGKTEWKGRKI